MRTRLHITPKSMFYGPRIYSTAHVPVGLKKAMEVEIADGDCRFLA